MRKLVLAPIGTIARNLTTAHRITLCILFFYQRSDCSCIALLGRVFINISFAPCLADQSRPWESESSFLVVLFYVYLWCCRAILHISWCGCSYQSPGLGTIIQLSAVGFRSALAVGFCSVSKNHPKKTPPSSIACSMGSVGTDLGQLAALTVYPVAVALVQQRNRTNVDGRRVDGGRRRGGLHRHPVPCYRCPTIPS